MNLRPLLGFGSFISLDLSTSRRQFDPRRITILQFLPKPHTTSEVALSDVYQFFIGTFSLYRLRER